MGANSSNSGSSKKGDSQLASYKAQYEGAKQVLARERERLAEMRRAKNSKSAIEAQKGAVERAKQHVERCKNNYDSYRRQCR